MSSVFDRLSGPLGDGTDVSELKCLSAAAARRTSSPDTASVFDRVGGAGSTQENTRSAGPAQQQPPHPRQPSATAPGSSCDQEFLQSSSSGPAHQRKQRGRRRGRGRGKRETMNPSVAAVDDQQHPKTILDGECEEGRPAVQNEVHSSELQQQEPSVKQSTKRHRRRGRRGGKSHEDGKKEQPCSGQAIAENYSTLETEGEDHVVAPERSSSNEGREPVHNDHGMNDERLDGIDDSTGDEDRDDEDEDPTRPGFVSKQIAKFNQRIVVVAEEDEQQQQQQDGTPLLNDQTKDDKQGVSPLGSGSVPRPTQSIIDRMWMFTATLCKACGMTLRIAAKLLSNLFKRAGLLLTR
jgi:hypothetical protein